MEAKWIERINGHIDNEDNEKKQENKLQSERGSTGREEGRKT
jgi:hypothetical protein